MLPQRLLQRTDPFILQPNPFGHPPFSLPSPLPPKPSSESSVIISPLPTSSGSDSILPSPNPLPSPHPLPLPNPLPSPSPTSSDASQPSSVPSDTDNSPPSPLPDWTSNLPHGPGIDEYHLYTGNGSIAAGWPHKSDWMSYSDM